MTGNPSKHQDSYLFERSPWNRRWLLLLLCVFFFGVDFLGVPYDVFPFLFIFPIMLLAWNWGVWPAIAVAFILIAARFTHYFVSHELEIGVLNVFTSLVRYGVIVLLAALTALIARQTRQLRQRVQLLEGMLPICSFCKNIRDGQGSWVRLESYISGHSTAQFSHGLCPDCLKKHYPDYADPPAG
ncbi:MAG: hypothetical protein ABUL66_01055 [Verrucomicrobiota bacterium]